MFLNRFFLIAIIFLSSVGCVAQVTGSDTVCAGYIYNYNANIPGAASYTWTVPANWYGLSGQGTSQINVTCNANAGQVCVEGFDSIGGSMGSQCLTTNMGTPAGGGGNWYLEPSGFNGVCDNVFYVAVTPTIVFTGGGGGCLGNCGGVSGSANPNAVYALYSGNIFQGIIGTSMILGLGTFYAAYVDTTLGRDFPQSVIITSGGGCGGSGGGTFSIGQIWLTAWVYQLPDPVCIGDTVTLFGSGGNSFWGAPWTQYGYLIPITSLNDPSHLDAIVTGASPGIVYNANYQITDGISSGSICYAWTSYSVNVINCNVSAFLHASDTSICENSCISFTNASANSTAYQWNFPGAIPDTSTDVNPINICYSTPGTYDVSLIASNSGHSDTLLLPNYITVVAPPQAVFTSIDTNFCPPHCLGFTNSSSNATSYEWNFSGAFPATSTNQNPQSICYNSSGTYDVTLISTNSGCSDTLTLPNYINVNAPPQNSMGANPVSFCPGSCTDFTNFSTNATTYQWSFPGATVDTSTLVNPFGICYNNPGQYGVVLVSSNGVCTDTLSVSNYITVYAQPSAISINNYDDSLVADQGFASYQWYLNGLVIPAATEYFYVATANGDYNVVATDSNGCEVEAAVFNVTVNVETIFAGEVFGIVPNPFSNKLLFHPFHSSNEKTSIIVLNNIGEKLFEKLTSYKDQEIDLSFLDAGIYFLSVQTDEGIMLKRIVKM